MKKIALVIFAVSALVLTSCERDDLSAFIGSSITDDVTDVTSDSFKFHGTFTLEGGVATSSAIGVFMDTKPGVNSGQYAKTTEPVAMKNGATYFSYTYSNIDTNNERIFEAGTTVYYRAYLRVMDTDHETYTYVYGDEKSFTVPVSGCTVMVYGLGGKNLDYDICKVLFAPMMKQGRNGDLQVTFMYKPSAIYQPGGELEQYNDLKGAQRWVMPSEGIFKNIWNENIEDTKDQQEYTIYAYNRFAIFAEQVGDKAFNMSDPQNLASFINWSMEKCPANKYILLMIDHGGGWDLYEDGISHAQTKAQLYDDNISKNSMSLIDFINGVKASQVGKLDGVMSIECLMATLENITATSEVSNTLMAAQEVTYCIDGNSFMENVKNGINQNASVFDIFSKLVDDYCEDYEFQYTDHGAYDLTKIETLLSPVTEAANFFNDKYKNSADWKVAIGEGVTKALWSLYLGSGSYERHHIAELKEQLKNWISLTDEQKDKLVEEINKINQSSECGFCFYDLLVQTKKKAEEYLDVAENPQTFGSEIETLAGIISRYDNALRSMAYINCTSKETDDTPYEYTSPSICLQSLNENVYGPITKTNLYGYTKSNLLTREDAISTYRNLLFDEKTAWSNFLIQSMTSGTAFFNDDRQYRQTGQ